MRCTATEAGLRRALFGPSPAAEVVIALRRGRAGWLRPVLLRTSRRSSASPVCISKISSSGPRGAAAASAAAARPSCSDWRSSAATDAWSGRFSTGTSSRSACLPHDRRADRWTTGRSSGLTGDALRQLRSAGLDRAKQLGEPSCPSRGSRRSAAISASGSRTNRRSRKPRVRHDRGLASRRSDVTEKNQIEIERPGAPRIRPLAPRARPRSSSSLVEHTLPRGQLVPPTAAAFRNQRLSSRDVQQDRSLRRTRRARSARSSLEPRDGKREVGLAIAQVRSDGTMRRRESRSPVHRLLNPSRRQHFADARRRHARSGGRADPVCPRAPVRRSASARASRRESRSSIPRCRAFVMASTRGRQRSTNACASRASSSNTHSVRERPLRPLPARRLGGRVDSAPLPPRSTIARASHDSCVSSRLMMYW